MNDYRITAKASGTGEDISRTITERTEKAARVAFSKMNKGTPHEILKSELVRENTSATKQQERDTLAKIQAMVEELGPDSYIKAAFAGCFEIADQNIEYDFGDSYKARAESAQRDAEKAMKDLAAANARIAELEASQKEADAARISLQRELEQAREKMLSPELCRRIREMVNVDMDRVKMDMVFLADNMADYSDRPQCQSFKNYAEQYKELRERRVIYERILADLNAAMQEDAGV